MENTNIAIFSGTFFIVWLVIAVFYIYVFWRIFEKAGQPGWASIIPIYNVYVLIKIVKKPGWWLILMFIPLVNFVIGIIVTLELAKVFGKDIGFGLGLLFLGFIFYPILAFDNSKYIG